MLEAPSITLPENLTCESTTATVRWDKVELADEYQLQVAADEDFTDCVINILTMDTDDALDYLHYGRTYHLRVRAKAHRDEDETDWYSEWTYADLTIPEPVDPHLVIPDPQVSWGWIQRPVMLTVPNVEHAEQVRVTASWNPDLSDPFVDESEGMSSGSSKTFQLVIQEEALGKTIYAKVEAWTDIADQTYYAQPYYAVIHVTEDAQLSVEAYTPPSSEPAEPDLMYGDADGNSKVDAVDATYILIEAATVGAGEPSTLTDIQRMASDVNHDAEINASDAAIVLIYAASVGAGMDVTIQDLIS